MPSMTHADLAAANALGQANIDIKDNIALSSNPDTHKGYVYLAKLDTSNSGHAFSDKETPEKILKELNSLDVVIAPRTRAVVFNELAIDWQLHSHQNAQNVNYHTVNEIVTGMYSLSEEEPKPITNLPTDARLIRVMTPLILHQYDQTYVALTRRGKGATYEGLWGCSSKLLGRPLTPDFVKAVANSELVVSVDNIMLMNTQLQLPKVPNTVNFHGGHANGQVECVAIDNAEERTLTLIFPMITFLPKGEATVENMEHPRDETELVRLPDLRKEEYSLMPGLKEYLLR